MSMTLNDLAVVLREHGITTAEVGTTGGNCHSIIVPLPDGGEVLVGDYEGPLSSGDERLDGIVAVWRDRDLQPVTGLESGEDGVLFASAEHLVDDEGVWIDWDADADARACAEAVHDSILDAHPDAFPTAR